MNLEQVKAMSDEDLRIKVSELCGWKCVRRSGSWIVGWMDNPSKDEEVPDYCEDLNAMHEAEKNLRDRQWVVYGQNLDRLGIFPMVHATARKRAEAFVLTMTKVE